MGKGLSQKRRLVSFLLVAVMLLTMMPVQTWAVGAQDKGSFVNGPYLLAPKEDSMVVVWELDQAMKATITYGATQQKTVDVAVEEGEIYQGKPMYMYRARLTGLTAGTTYDYTVKLENGQSAVGHFRTLSSNPSQIRFVVISDSHRFETAQQVSDMIAQFDPDFILHTGDMVEGTGSQKDQFSYWFRNIGSFLGNVPVIYNSGNHDYGIYFDEYVTKVQKEQYHSNQTGRNVSFQYGPIHVAMLDSNPWSLFELNSAAGGQVDPSTKAVVDESLNWLKEDLASAQAKNADFRIVTMHHPYEDDLTRKYIPPIVEAGNVNIMFSGHTHVYSRFASPNATRGTSTMYVTQGDARIGDGKIDTGKKDQRLDENYPNLLATGKGDMLKVTVKDGLLSYSNVGLEGDTEKVYETVTLSKDGAKLAYDDVSITPESILSGGTVTVSAKVTNVGAAMAAASFAVADNGAMQYLYLFGQAGKERVVALEAGESAQLSATLPLTALGTHTLQFANVTQKIAVTFRKADYTYNNLLVRFGTGETNDPESDVLRVRADVRNIGNEAGTATAALLVNGKQTDSKQVYLTAGQTRSVEFTYNAPTGGAYQLSIGTSAQKTVTVLSGIQGTPIVKDKSGLGNDGIIRGNPKLVQYSGGYGLSLDGEDDYVEIPDRGNYVIDNGMTGMVWANIDHFATGNQWDHNPLLMKGASISYGTNYLFRMAVRKTGMVTYGVGFDNDNGEYFWNDDENIAGAGAKLGTWVQYTGGFDRSTGGTSWENGKLSGEIEAPDFDSLIKNWEGKSMYSGFSFHRHLLPERGRGKTHTMLTGEIGQIRFYTEKLTEASNKAIYATPQNKGPQGDKLAVWLDFDPKNIDGEGKHITQWQGVIGALQTFTYDAEIAVTASAKAMIETSDDGKTVKQSKEVVLQNGGGTVDLSQLDMAKFVRISTMLHSSVTQAATNVPMIHSYIIDAGNRNSWTTLADWNKGTFTGAVGHESRDIFNDYANDYDAYMGTADVSQSVASDLSQSHWAYQNIKTLMDKGVVRGDSPSGRVRPNASITREEVAAALLGALDIPAEQNGAIVQGDASSAWAKDILATAKARGILNGNDNGFLNGKQTATRAQVMTMIARVAGWDSADTAMLNQFTDSSQVPQWARSSMAGLLQNGMLTGYEDHTLRANSPISRAEVFTLLSKLTA